jgi:hypothetical protein
MKKGTDWVLDILLGSIKLGSSACLTVWPHVPSLLRAPPLSSSHDGQPCNSFVPLQTRFDIIPFPSLCSRNFITFYR